MSGEEEFVRMLQRLRIELEKLRRELQPLGRELRSFMESENDE